MGGVKLLEILCSVGGNRAVPGAKVTGSFKRDSECSAFFICGLWRSNWSLGARGSGKMFIAEKRQKPALHYSSVHKIHNSYTSR